MDGTAKENVKRYYDERVAQFSDDMLVLKEEKMRPLYEKMLEFTQVDKQTIVGIIGSSTGSMGLFVAPRAKKVVGVDLSEASLRFAERRAGQLGIVNIENKLGDAEALPWEDSSIDVVLSDCVINLVPDKQAAFKEIFRVLKENGTLVMADPVKNRPLNDTSDELLAGCIAGAVAKEDYERMLEKAGFDGVETINITDFAKTVFAGHEEKFDKYGLDYVIVKARKPEKLNTSNGEKSLKSIIREGYARIAQQGGSCCCGPASPQVISLKVGYNEEELKAVPEGSNLGLGCGNPVALASINEGETVLDLGSGPGLDCFLAADRVGPKGKVIGVDMTPEMVMKARANAQKGDYENVEFRLGEIENLPVADNSVDVIISNCVINLSPDKKRVFEEAFRVLKPGGRMVVSDIVLLKELPDVIKSSVEAYVGCLSGAMLREDYLSALKTAGFKDVEILDETSFPVECMVNDPTAKVITENLNISDDLLKAVADSVISIKVAAVRLN